MRQGKWYRSDQRKATALSSPGKNGPRSWTRPPESLKKTPPMRPSWYVATHVWPSPDRSPGIATLRRHSTSNSARHSNRVHHGLYHPKRSSVSSPPSKRTAKNCASRYWTCWPRTSARSWLAFCKSKGEGVERERQQAYERAAAA